MKWISVAVNLFAAGALVVLGEMAAAVHEAHGYSTYREFVIVGAVDEQQLETLPVPNSSGARGYNMRQRLSRIGDAESWFRGISWFAAIMCVLNANAVFFLAGRKCGATRTPAQTPSPPR